MSAGQLVFAFGAYHDKVIVMQVGRAIFGFGGESIYVAIFKLATRWFSDSKQLNMAITFLYCVPNMVKLSFLNLALNNIFYFKRAA